MLNDLAIPCSVVAKVPGDGLDAIELIDSGAVDLIINVPVNTIGLEDPMAI